MTFSRRGDDSVVEVAIDIAVDVLGITVFRFTHRAEEVWRGGQLWSLVSDTDDDGTRWRVQAERRKGMLRGSVHGAGFAAPGSLLHRKSVVQGERVSDGVVHGGGGRIKK